MGVVPTPAWAAENATVQRDPLFLPKPKMPLNFTGAAMPGVWSCCGSFCAESIGGRRRDDDEANTSRRPTKAQTFLALALAMVPTLGMGQDQLRQ
jgi:hypothetical protein